MASRRCTNRLSSWFAFLLLFVAGIPGGATTVVQLNDYELVRHSENVVYATVSSNTSRWNDDKTIIVTDVSFTVKQTLKGNAAQGQLDLTIFGGQADGLIASVVGAPKFRVGEDVVLFINRSAGEYWPLVGLSQGKVVVTDDGHGRLDERTERREDYLQTIKQIVESQREGR